MGKYKSKAKSKDNGAGFLGSSAKQIGVALATAVAAQLVEEVVEKIVQKSADNSSEQTDHSDQKSFDQKTWKPLQSAVSEAGDQLNEIGPALNHSATSVRSSVSELTVDDVVDALKEVGHRFKERSNSTLGHSSEALVETITNGAQAAAALLPNLGDSQDEKKSNKKDKKKKKKKKKKK